VADAVASADFFAFGSLGSGGAEGVGAVGADLIWCCHVDSGWRARRRGGVRRIGKGLRGKGKSGSGGQLLRPRLGKKRRWRSEFVWLHPRFHRKVGVGNGTLPLPAKRGRKPKEHSAAAGSPGPKGSLAPYFVAPYFV
jgi:hypothetical protein